MHPLVRHIRETLHGCYSDAEALSLAKMLLVEVFGFSTLELYGGKDKTFSENQQDVLDKMLARLQKNEPIQYIIGKETFCGLEFEVDKNVLIPRPETRELVEWVVADCTGKEGCRVLDIGTGSGSIAVCLAKFMDSPRVEAWDISAGALQVAERNAGRNGVQVDFRRQDVLADVPEGGSYDVIVSNPPYITEKEKTAMEPNVLDWEPSTALFVPDADPLRFYRRIAQLGRTMLCEGGGLYFEINREYGKETLDMLTGLEYNKVELRKDAFGNDRMIKAIK